ncbi:MAG TPA: 2-succinyl-5-enolpyruvyl-6-hydroxy-3-cyclohexene-1-carboxylic-acid synthase, partial [Deltaproteobacteria bacterium]|nr:2-succinyl-5-enolpyruvyl-6-hydroxy-3-cyclohexene-1-carboxylic-acid synthase [Deltaproteobacteria bacterium]
MSIASPSPSPEPDAPSTGFRADPPSVQRFIDRFFEALAREGVREVVISPGSRSTPLAVAADRRPDLRTRVILDERSAGFFALGLARASQRPVALVCTSGTAAANYLPAIVEAHYSRIPLVVLTADRPPELRDWAAGQTIVQADLYARHCRWSVEVPVPAGGAGPLRYAAQLGSRAAARAAGRPAGVVHLNWPLREPLTPGPDAFPIRDMGAQASHLHFHTSTAESVSRPEDVEELVALARAHARGVICCGPMDMGPGLARSIDAFARASGWPVLADPASCLRQASQEGSDAPGAIHLDLADAFLRSERFRMSMRPDVVVRIGDVPVSKIQRLWIEASAPRHLWWLDEGEHWGDPSHRVTRVVRGGARSLLFEAAGALEDHSASMPAWREGFVRANRVARNVVSRSVGPEAEWFGLSVVARACACLPDGSMLYVSNSMPIRLLDLGLRNRPVPLRVLCNRGANGIDGVTSSALGAAAASGGPALLMTGDLAFLHDLGALAIPRHERIPLTILILDDNGGGIFSNLPIA